MSVMTSAILCHAVWLVRWRHIVGIARNLGCCSHSCFSCDSWLSPRCKCFAEPLEALGHGEQRVFLAFEFERDIAPVVVPLEDRRDSRIVEFEGIPQAATVIGFGLDENGLRCEQL